MKILIAILATLLLLVGSFYLVFNLCLVGGIVQTIEGYQAEPNDASDIAWGIVRIIISFPVFWTCLFLDGACITVIWIWAMS